MCCKKKPIYIQKRGLCQGCSSKFYNERYRQTGNRMAKYWEVRHGNEVEFVKNFFTHKNWIYHPAIFRLDGKNYEPDFYDGERNMFIEVTGTHQAFNSNKQKYKQFIKTYPLVNFEMRYNTGELLSLTEMKYHIPEKR